MYINNIHSSYVTLLLIYNWKRPKTSSEWVHMNNFKVKIHDKLTDAIVISLRTEHGHFVKLGCCYNTLGTPCYATVCDVCLYSRQQTVKNYPKLKPISHLLCTKYYLKRENNLTLDLPALTLTKVDGYIDRNSEHF